MPITVTDMSKYTKPIQKRLVTISTAKNTFIRDTIEHYIDIGEQLETAHGDVTGKFFAEWVEEELPFNRAQANKYRRIAKHKESARRAVTNGSDHDIDSLQKLLPLLAATPLETTADPKQMAYVQAARNKDDWHTPQEYIEDARLVMDTIDLDPFSSVQANATVRAARFYTLADDALAQDWGDANARTVFMNPPYSNGKTKRSTDKFLDELDSEAFEEGIVLTNASTDTIWFHDLLASADAVCFTKGRISFVDAGGKRQSGNTRGQAFFYFGPSVGKFASVFSHHGAIISIIANVEDA